MVDGLIAGQAAFTVGVGALAIFAPQLSHAPVRAAAAALATATGALVLSRRRRVLLLMPLFTLGLVTVAFFSFMPWLTLRPVMAPERLIRPDNLASIKAFLGGRGEFLVLQFAFLCLAGALLQYRLDIRPSMPRIMPAKRTRLLVAGAGTVIAVAVAVLLARLSWAGAEIWTSRGLGREILFAVPPLIAVSLAALTYLAAAHGGRLRVVAFLCGLASVAALLTTGMSKMSVFIALADLAFYAVLKRISWPGMVGALIAGTIVFVGAAVVNLVIREPDFRAYGSPFDIVGHAITIKLFSRQAVTAGCFQTALDKELPRGEGDTPFYFVSGVVPRLLWPDKPSLSVGGQYAFAYCHVTPAMLAPGRQDSESITLLGQPIVRAGWRGLFVAELAILFGLSAVWWVGIRRGPAGIIGIVAILPWLVDFDQSFALYVANSIKMFIWMVPALVAVHRLCRE